MNDYQEQQPKEKLIRLTQLFWSFIKIGALTFGGGSAMLPILQHEIIDKRKWIDEKDAVDYFAIGQSTPGIIAVNVAAFVGNSVAGFWGILVASIAVTIPSIIVIIIIAHFIEGFTHIAWVQRLMHGVNVAVAVILSRAVYTFSKTTISDKITLLVAIASFMSLYVFNIAGVWVVLSAALLGVLFAPRDTTAISKDDD